MVTDLVQAECRACHRPPGNGLFCRNCGVFVLDPRGTVVVASRLSRLGAWFVNAILFVVTLGVGWVIWWFIVAPRGQNPGKAVVGLRIIKTDGSAVTTGWMFLRGLLGFVLGFIPFFVDELWLLFDQNAQTLHDKVAETVVVKAQGSEHVVEQGSVGTIGSAADQPVLGAPARGSSIAEQLRELARLHDEKVLTDEEYERKRRELVAKL